ncbi:MAG: cytidyltransferase [Chloroflexi bacterium]|nr:cytidyltransferase [Chloroflexota bacterium]
MSTVFAMIPARMGSQRLKQKNLREIAGMPLARWAMRRCKEAGVFDAIWMNSEHPAFGEMAAEEEVDFHQRPAELANDSATSEQFVYEFLTVHPCDYVFQVHTIAPLLRPDQIAAFVHHMLEQELDVLLSVVHEQIECAIGGEPINFTLERKTNSQELQPIQRVTWSITGWRSATYLAAFEAGGCATYAGRVGYYPIDRLAGHIIKTEDDWRIAQALFPLRYETDR